MKTGASNTDPLHVHLGGTARSPDDLAAIHELGFRFAEVPITDPDRFESSKDTYIALKKQLGLYYLCHGPREGDPNNKTSLENVYLPKLMKILSIMPELAMKLLSVHLWLDSRYVRPDVIDYKIEFLRRIILNAKRSDIMVCLENLSENPNDMKRVLDALPSLNLTLDLGHAQLLTPVNVSCDFIDRFPTRIKHIHLHDNLGGHSPDDDLHLPVGQGIIDFESIFKKLRAIGYDRTITLELRPPEIKKCLKRVQDLVQAV
jgi:sugar phosphate isomerase/epimerase